MNIIPTSHFLRWRMPQLPLITCRDRRVTDDEIDRILDHINPVCRWTT